MAKANIKIVAATAEIVASVAVVVSLLFVVYSINQNTASLQAVNDNFLYQMHDDWLSAVDSDDELASIVAKYVAGEDLGRTEQMRYKFWVWRLLAIWELSFSRHMEGLLPPAQWDAWDVSIANHIPYYLSEDQWLEYRNDYSEAFAEHVDAIYSNQ